jgi:hypothetical protein
VSREQTFASAAILRAYEVQSAVCLSFAPFVPLLLALVDGSLVRGIVSLTVFGETTKYQSRDEMMVL